MRLLEITLNLNQLSNNIYDIKKQYQDFVVTISKAPMNSMADLLKSYQSMATKVNGLMVDDSGYNANDITALRHAVFLGDFPSILK